MSLPIKLINLKHFIKNNLNGINDHQITKSIKNGLEESEESMFVGSVFCSDLLPNANEEVIGRQKYQDIYEFQKRIGVMQNQEKNNLDSSLKNLLHEKKC